MTQKRADATIVAWRVREGTQILMPDNRTWCTVKSISREKTGLLFMTLVEGGFTTERPDALLRVRGQVAP